MKNKNDVRDILALKLAGRICRKRADVNETILEITRDCSRELNVDAPEVLFCESLAKDFQAFELRGKSYFIYDICLIETMGLYNACAVSGFQEMDMYRFFES